MSAAAPGTKVALVSLFANVNAWTNVAVEIGAVLEDIRNGKFQKQIEEVRRAYALGGKDAADEVKKKLLPAVAITGTFNGRHRIEDFKEHSGHGVLDFDHLNGNLNEGKLRLASDPFVFAVFISPSGAGLKVVVKIKPDASEHKLFFAAATAYFKQKYNLDTCPTGSDISRLCFTSFDPALIHNPAAAVFEIPVAPVGRISQLPRTSKDAKSAPRTTATLTRYVQSAVEAETRIVSTTPNGQRNAALNKSAFALGQLVGAGALGRADAEQALMAAARSCKLPDQEAAETIKSGLNAGEKEPRQMPEPRTSTQKKQKQANSSTQSPRDLEAKFGPAYFFHVKPKTKEKIYQGLNESYFAGLHAVQNIELWEPQERTFYKYEKHTGLYQDATIDTIKQEISESILVMARTEKLIGLIKDRADRRLSAIVSQLKGVIEKRDAFKKSEPFIHLANGVLVFRNNDADLTEFSPDYFSRNQSPITFDPNARCDRFLNELILPAVHPEDVAIVQKYIGLCLMGRNIIQRFMILDGTPGGGKSQLAIVIQLLVGLLNCTQLRTEHLHERFELYRFLKKTLLVGVDVPADFLSTRGAAVIKALVGGDILDAEQKNGTGCFPLEGTFCIVVTSNSRLQVRLEGDTGAWRRRLLIVRYEASPPAKKIPDFGKTLVATEGPGILNWALQGLAALLHDVEKFGDIQLTSRQSGMVDSLLAESDSLRFFLRDCVMRSNTGDLTVSEIIQSYAEYCPTKGWNPLPITVLHRQVEALMLELFQTVKVHCIERDEKQQKGFHHVCFK